MATETPVPIQDLKQRLAQAGGDAERLAALMELRYRIAELTRAEAEGYLKEAVELARKTGNLSDLASAGIAASEFYRNIGDIARSLECADIVQEAATASGNPNSEGSYLYLLGRAHEVRGGYKLARDCYEACLRVWRRAGNARSSAAALNQLGNLAALQGQAAEALEYFQECLKIDDELGDITRATTHQYNIGWTLARLGRWEDAFESYYRAIALAEQYRMPALRAAALNSLGELFLERDKAAKAIDIFRMVQEASERGEVLPEMLHDTMANLGLAYRRQGDLASAGQAYDQALAAAEESGDRRVAAIVLWRRAELALDQGQLDRCRELAERSIAVAREVGLRCEEAQALRVMALLHAARGEDAQARDCFEQAMARLRDLEESLDLARVRFHHGRYLLTQGEQDSAVTHLKAASRAFRKLGIVAEGHEVNRLLFQQEMGVDSDMALLQGISGLTSLGVEPKVLLERAIGLLLEALRFDSAAIVARGRPVLMLGNPDLKPTLALGASQEPVFTDLVLSWPVRYGGSLLGRIHLERAVPVTTVHNHLVLDTIANLLAAPIHRLTELAVGAVEERPGLAGLRYQGVVSRNQRMADVLVTVCTVASKSVPVLLRGEKGTGKELIARALHDSGTRAGRPFVAVNCTAVPENLLEVELFGIERGTATGVAARKGRFETADGGTIFLDEIGDMGPALQSKLLRVFQEKTFERVGGGVPISVDVRVVAATNQPLAEFVAQRKFREDLYHRLSAVDLMLPSLNERPEDIPDLVRHFVRRSSQEFGRHVDDVSPEVMSRLEMHRWLGNVRELEQVVERSVLLARGATVQLDDLPPSLRSETVPNQ
jgi:transcriptional regulator with AAA-type ATPase domain/tetratricopeptide (TPR) repeat protein